MIFIAMLIGPAIGRAVSLIERALEHRLPSGYELLTANFIFAVLAGGLAVACFLHVGQFLSGLILKLNELILQVAWSGWLPVTAAFIEPAKVLFLNNVMSYGILGPIGISQIRDLSKSIFFLLESNPGPAIGVLLAYIIRLRGQVRRNAASSLAIHALGGIQEVYFPYVLMRPQLLIALILGSMSGIWVFDYWNAGLVSIPSPPSLLLMAGLSPPGDMLIVMLGIGVSAAVSLAASLVLVGSAEELRERNVDSREHELIRRLEHVGRWLEVSPVLRNPLDTRPEEKPAAENGGAEGRRAGDAAGEGAPSGESASLDGVASTGEGAAIGEGAGAREGGTITVCFACDAGLGSSAMAPPSCARNCARFRSAIG